MSKVRIDSSVHDRLREYLEDSESWSKQSSFVSQAVREKLERQTSEDEAIDEEQENAIRKIVKEELEQYS